MRKIRLLAPIAALVAAALMFAACANPFAENREEGTQSAIPNGFGTVRVSAVIQDAARTAMPTAPTGFNHYKYWFAKGEAAEAQETADEDGKFYLEPGSYTVTVKGFATAATTSLAGQGTSASFNVTLGADAGMVNVALSPIDNDGDGTLSHTLTYPEGVTVATYTLTLLAGTDPINLTSGAATSTADGVTTMSGSKTVDAGYYLLQVSLERADGAVAGKTEVVYIYKELITTTDVSAYTFTGAEFITPGTVNTTYDSSSAATNVGSLRWAITQNNLKTEGGTIIIDLPPGSVIALTSALPSITKNLVLEGNGVTVSGSGISQSSSSRILTIAASTVVTIRRLRFDQGKITGNGAAISNSGTTTLESCIFSGNQATANGGAIHGTTGTLTVRGSTFYNNSTSSVGGAIYSSVNVSLMGNLFYGNTADTKPVMGGSSSAITSGGSNVSDKVNGTSDAGSGWNFVTTGSADTQIAGPPLAPASFKLLSGSGALNKLPSELPTYPSKDFYGNDITGGGAAGAVQATAGAGYYVLSLTTSGLGTIAVSPAANEDGLYSGSVMLTATPTNASSTFHHWVQDGEPVGSTGPLELTINAHTTVQAVWTATVTLTSGTNAGSLPYAINNAADGDIIVITSGLTITLTATLPTLNKSVTIEGNGATVSGNSAYKIMTIGSASIKPTVTIRRLRFDKGQDTNYGGAIRNYGTTTLESCIFSTNKVTAIPSTGGAIYNDSNGTLTVKGCTFFKNTVDTTNASSSGGAIYNKSTGTVSFTGNLFQGNTAYGYKVVKNDGGTLTSGGYNVSDITLGAAIGNSGWDAGTGDRQSLAASLGELNATSIKPPAGANMVTYLQIVPTDLAGFPLTDFGGQTRSDTVDSDKTAAGAWSTAQE